jgi:type 1 glutamine amidotransferase
VDRSDTLLFVTQVAPYSPRAPYHTAFGLAGAHGVLPQAWLAFRQIADVVDLRAQLVEDVRDLRDDAVAGARAVVLFTIGETPWSATQRTDLLDGVQHGRTALVVVHSGLDACLEWPDYGRLAGARFDGHPWTGEFEADVVDRDHPATAHLDDTWRCVDEIYTFRDLRPDARVLLRVPAAQLDLASKGVAEPDFGFPLSWCADEGAGRTFTTALGHFPTCWESNAYLAHVAGGLTWALDS